MLIQFILVPIIVVIIAVLFVRYRSGDLNFQQLAAWLILWVGAAAVISLPELASRLADIAGVQRGADLVIYVSVVVIFYLLFRLLVRLEKIERDLTTIVSHLAIIDQEIKKD